MNSLTKLMAIAFMASSLYSVPTASIAGQFNPLVGNPFIFCSSPKPCKYCQPYRRIYGEICDSQKDAPKTESNVVFTGTRQEIRAEINRLMPELNSENRLLNDAAIELDSCRVSKGACSAETANYHEKQETVEAYMNEIARLQRLLVPAKPLDKYPLR